MKGVRHGYIGDSAGFDSGLDVTNYNHHGLNEFGIEHGSSATMSKVRLGHRMN